jgi:hypothetical protein
MRKDFHRLFGVDPDPIYSMPDDPKTKRYNMEEIPYDTLRQKSYYV